MKRIPLLVVVILAAAGAASAETRWCDVTGMDTANKLEYPPFAALAHVSGTVASRLMIAGDGSVVSTQPVAGLPILASPVNAQLQNWKFTTTADGNEPCQSLVVVRCFVDTSVSSRSELVSHFPSHLVLLDLVVEPEPIEVIVYDPVLRGWSLFRHRTARTMRKLFRSQR